MKDDDKTKAKRLNRTHLLQPLHEREKKTKKTAR